MIRRRDFLIGATATAAVSPLATATAFGRDVSPPLNDKAAFIAWGKANTNEDPVYLERRFDRYKDVLSFNDLYTPAEKRAFLLTPRQEFTRPQDKDQAYVGHCVDIGFGVTITPPGAMGRMTSTLEVRNGEKALEIGTGSGYQSALLT